MTRVGPDALVRVGAQRAPGFGGLATESWPSLLGWAGEGTLPLRGAADRPYVGGACVLAGT